MSASRKLSAPPDADGNSDAFPASPGAGASESTPSSSSKSDPFMGDQIDLPVLSSSTHTPSSPYTYNALSARDAASDSAFTPSMFFSTNNPLSFAIPLGFVLCITIVAVVLAVYHFRKRLKRQTMDTEKLATLSRLSSRDSMYKGPLEYPASAALPAHVSGPVPLFMPVDLETPPAQETRRPTRKLAILSPTVKSAPPLSRQSQVVTSHDHKRANAVSGSARHYYRALI
ncbi:hypothetical protein C0992_004754 [Termitomyces sp. T32_za158]|nr:hypothetical protein C0992_004754 [Termitomyces sp. T32_za158]